jgi:L-alanine-DL-glutamate epimerase-like enolase superfamily enzyme
MKKPVEKFHNGYVAVPEGPGLDIDLNKEVAKKFAIPRI